MWWEPSKSLWTTKAILTKEEVVLNAVCSDKEGSANKQWCKWTPYVNFTFTISNPQAFAKVLPGQFMFVDLIPTDKDSL